MGVGKTTTCEMLQDKLKPSVFLDGDWCWNMNPFIVTEETKAMVVDNIIYLLNNFLDCSEYEYIIFCWVMHKESIIKEILDGLHNKEFELVKITLICTEEALRERLGGDVKNNIRDKEVIERSVQRLSMYQEMNTYKLDISDITVYQVTEEIIRLLGEGHHEDSTH